MAPYPHLIVPTVACARSTDRFRVLMAAAASAAAAAEEGEVDVGNVVSESEARCPNVIVLDRQGGENGRNVTNWAAVLESLRDCVPACGSFRVVNLATLAPTLQHRAVASATVVVAVRGAATASVFFLRPLGGVFTLAPLHTSAPVNAANDNMPWWPLDGLRTDVVVSLAGCRAVGHRNVTSPYHRLCMQRSVNFCNLECAAPAVGALFRRFLLRLRNNATRLFLEQQTGIIRGRSSADEQNPSRSMPTLETLIQTGILEVPGVVVIGSDLARLTYFSL